jgi:DNA-binding NarL/FixJ family response regulator
MSAVDHRELTAVERQVARLVAWGGSNRDVAEALGIEAAAVERHLAHVYRKLGIHSDADLPRLSVERQDTRSRATTARRERGCP